MLPRPEHNVEPQLSTLALRRQPLRAVGGALDVFFFCLSGPFSAHVSAPRHPALAACAVFFFVYMVAC